MLLELDVAEVEKLQAAMSQYQDDVEEAINAVLHGEGAELIEDSVQRLMPVSGARWKGKKAAAKDGKSLKHVNANLSTTVTTTKNYQYLYFPDCGENTRRHVGNQQFFYKGAEAVKGEVIDRCLKRLTNEQ